jgi:hypothetical protein
VEVRVRETALRDPVDVRVSIGPPNGSIAENPTSSSTTYGTPGTPGAPPVAGTAPNPEPDP